MDYPFDAVKECNAVIQWIKDKFEPFSKRSVAVVGISGGKDSTVVAALCAKALGKDRVFGVLMPNGEQSDIDYSYEVCKHLGIKYKVVNIKNTVNSLIDSCSMTETTQSMINLPPRIRMSTLYYIAQCVCGFVMNTCNASEDYVGYSTKYGDNAGECAPLKEFTSEEVIELGRVLEIPEKFLVKPPSDGLCGKTDEDNLGFTYAVLNKYIRTGVIDDQKTKETIDHLHTINLHKELPIARFERYMK